jgi:hypothetical protein
MGSKPRRYPVGGIQIEEKREVTKTEILAVLEAENTRLMSRAELFVAIARRHKEQDWSNPNPLSWARTIIAVPAGERLLEKMVQDGQVVSRGGGEWVALGETGFPANGVYYTSLDKAGLIDKAAEEKRDKKRFEKAVELATAALVAQYQERYSELLHATLADLKAKD